MPCKENGRFIKVIYGIEGGGGGVKAITRTAFAVKNCLLSHCQ
jgi:hypothetical protein